MEDVAEHINEMQRIHDEYGQIFDELSRSRPPHTGDIEVGMTNRFNWVDYVLNNLKYSKNENLKVNRRKAAI